VDSITENGLITPLLVLPFVQGGVEHYGLVAGYRRTEALRRIRAAGGPSSHKFAEVPVTFFEGDIEEAKFVNLAENLNRKTVTPMESAERIREFLRQGYEQKDVARRLGRSPAWVSTILSVDRNSGKKVKAALRSGSIKTAHAKEISRLSEAEQEEMLEKVIQSGMTLRELKKAVDERLGEERVRLRPVAEFQEKLEEMKARAENESLPQAQREFATAWLDALCWATQVESPLASAQLKRMTQAAF